MLRSIINRLKTTAISEPTQEKWLEISQRFHERWNFPHVLGAIDGKHVRIRCPNNSGSLFFNYKHYFSIVLLAIVDADYKFLCVDIGSYGREGDSGIFQKSVFGQRIRNNSFNIPESTVLNGKQCFQIIFNLNYFRILAKYRDAID